MPVVVRALISRGKGDCAIVALGNFLGKSYEDVLTAAAHTSTRRSPHHTGLTTTEIKRVANFFGVALRWRRKCDPFLQEGIAGFTRPGPPRQEHVAFVKHGLVWDMDGSQVEWAHYCTTEGWRPVSLLTREDR